MNSAPVVLVIEDEEPMRRSLEWLLRHEGYIVRQACDASRGFECFEHLAPDVILLDLGLPDMPGAELAVRIRARSLVPIIVVSARDQEMQKIEALDAGANDYVTKPFSPGELLARVRVALRMALDAGGAVPRVVRVGDLCIDLLERSVSLAGKRIELTQVEYQILRVLAQIRGNVATHERLVREVWGVPVVDERVNNLRVYVKRIRCKIEQSPARPRYLLTEFGVGYRLALEMEA